MKVIAETHRGTKFDFIILNNVYLPCNFNQATTQIEEVVT
jgi:hypothetical protein